MGQLCEYRWLSELDGKPIAKTFMATWAGPQNSCARMTDWPAACRAVGMVRLGDRHDKPVGRLDPPAHDAGSGCAAPVSRRVDVLGVEQGHAQHRHALAPRAAWMAGAGLGDRHYSCPRDNISALLAGGLA
jgi:hypothetical protein